MAARRAIWRRSFIKPNDRLTSFDRLEIYNRVYWFRVLDCLYDDYPGLRAVLGERKFMKLITAYLAKYPSASFTLRNLGSRLEKFLREEPRWVAPRAELALDMVALRMGAGRRLRRRGETRDYARRHSGRAARQVAARFAAVSLAARTELRGGRVLCSP